MRFRRGRSILAASGLLALSLVMMSPDRPRSEGTVLARVDKVQPTPPDAAVVAAMDVLQELEGAWIVRIPESMAERLRAERISHQVFEPVSGDVLFLVSSSVPQDLEALRAAGTVWPVDATTSLLATADEQVRERIPAHLHLKRLGDRLAVVPTFRTASARSAKARAGWDLRVAGGSAIPEMVGQVNATAIADTIKKLEAFQTRYASQPSCALAGTWLFDAFAAMGLAVERDTFPFGSYTGTNIVATLPGRTYPSQVVVVGAHYDSYSNDAVHHAPGADDNASGTAAVLELARVLGRYSFDFTIQFVAFSAEEWGLYGSKHFAQEARSSGRQIVAMIDLDMVAYTDRLPEDLDMIVNAGSEWLANAFAGAASAYAPVPTLKVVNASLTYSDHAPFWDQGYSAMCGIEDASPTNPNYHKTYDTFGTLNMDFETSVARATLATVAALAQPFATPPPPANLAVEAQVLGSTFMRAQRVRVTWTAAPGATGYHVYRAVLSRGTYTRLTVQPVTGTSFADRLMPTGTKYYYLVRSVDANGNEGNASAEVALR